MIGTGTAAPHDRILEWNKPLPWCLIGIGLLLAGILAVASWKFYLAAVGGLIVGSAVLLRPRLGLYLIAATVPLDAVGRIADLLPAINISLAKIAVLLTLGAWVVHVALGRARVYWCKEATLWCIYLLIAIISLADSGERDLGYQAAIRLATSIVFYVLVFNLVRSRRTFYRTLAVFVTVSVLGFGFGIAQRYLPGFAFDSRVGWDEAGAQTFGVEMHDLDAGSSGTVARSSGLTYHAIILAIDIDVILPLLIGGILIATSPWRRALLWGAVLIGMGALLTTHSRTGMLILLLSVGLLVVRGLLKFTTLRIILLVVGLAAAIPFIPDTFVERVLNPKSYTVAGSESLRQRVDLLKAGGHALLEHPVNGLGLETTYKIYDYFDYPDHSAVVTVHNGYLQVALELGVFGITVLLAFFWRTLRSLRRAVTHFRRAGDNSMAIMSECIFVSIIVFLGAGFTVDFMRIGFKNIWLLLALAPALYSLSLAASRNATARDQPAATRS